MAVTEIDIDAKYWEIVNRLKAEKAKRIRPPVVKLYDGDWILRGRVSHMYKGSVAEIEHDSGTATIEMPEEYYLSKWVVDVEGRATANVHLSVEKDGVRWTGRMKRYEIDRGDDGKTIVRLIFLHDYEDLKQILCWANPLLPAEIQFPRLWFLFGPAKWCLKTTLLMNIFRLESGIWTIPDDPLDPANWFDLDPSNWSMVVKPDAHADDTSPLAIVHSRFKTFHDMAVDVAKDAQLTPVLRRWFEGDEEPWPGAGPDAVRHGCLVIDYEDNSGWLSGTSFGGNLFTGLIHALVNIGSDGYNDGVDILPDPAFYPPEYSEPGWLGTLPQAPGIVFREGEHTGIQTSMFIGEPAGAVQHVTGGHSMPGVNEAISAAIQIAGDMVAAMIGVPPVGGAADAILKPLYCVSGDTIIDGPDGKERVDVLAERGGSFRVWALTPAGKRISAHASLAFKKASAEMFEYRLANGCVLTATAHHRWLTKSGWTEAGATPVGTLIATQADAGGEDLWSRMPVNDLPDAVWCSVPGGGAVEYSELVAVRPVGVRDVYDMHVPGWVNYSGNGIWSHNTDVFLAFMHHRDSARAADAGFSHYHERMAEGADRAYTLKALIALRTSMWATRETFRHKLTIADAKPWKIGQRGKGHFYLGHRIGSTVRGTPKGKIYVDRVSEVKLSWDRKKTPTWEITIGEREFEDPVIKALKKVQELFSIANDLGVL